MPEPLSDEALVDMIRTSDKELYREVIQRYEPKLERYIRKFILDPDERADVLQETFIKAYRNLQGFDTKKKFSSWIYRIAHNESLNHIKKYAKEKVSLEEHDIDVIDREMNLGKAVDRALLSEAFQKALVRLKPKHREPLILFFFEEKSYEEISDILRLPKNTVGTLISRGKTYIKTYLDEHSAIV